MLPISKEVLDNEIKITQAILTKWQERIAEGIPVIETPAPDLALHDFLRELCGEFSLLATKLDSISTILTDALSDLSE